MDVLEAKNERASTGDGFDESADGPEELLAAGRAFQSLADELGVVAPCEQRHHAVLTAELGDHVPKWPEGDALSVREAPPGQDRCPAGNLVEELAGEPRLADSRRAEQREQVARLLGDAPPVRATKVLELAAAADETSVEPTLVRGRAAVDGDEPPRVNRRRLAFRAQRLHRVEVRRGAHKPPRGVADDDLSCGRRLLEALGDVDRVARDERPTTFAGHDLAGVNSDADREQQASFGLELLVQLRQRVAHPVGRPHRAQRVVLMELRDPEHRHHAVAHELLHRPAEPLDLAARDVEPAGECGPDGLWIEPLAESGGVGHVREQDGDRLAGDGHAVSVGRVGESA